MNKKLPSNPLGFCVNSDCPDVNHGPKSSEHDGRFNQRTKTGAQMIKNDAAVAQNLGSTHNQVK